MLDALFLNACRLDLDQVVDVLLNQVVIAFNLLVADSTQKKEGYGNMNTQS